MSEDRYELGYPGGRVNCEDSEGIGLCSTCDVSNGNPGGDLEENTLGGVLGADNELRIWDGYILGLV